MVFASATWEFVQTYSCLYRIGLALWSSCFCCGLPSPAALVGGFCPSMSNSEFAVAHGARDICQSCSLPVILLGFFHTNLFVDRLPGVAVKAQICATQCIILEKECHRCFVRVAQQSIISLLFLCAGDKMDAMHLPFNDGFWELFRV